MGCVRSGRYETVDEGIMGLRDLGTPKVVFELQESTLPPTFATLAAAIPNDSHFQVSHRLAHVPATPGT